MKSLSKFTITEQRENKRLVGNGETFGKFLSTYHLAPGTPGESGAWPCELIPISIVRPEVALISCGIDNFSFELLFACDK